MPTSADPVYLDSSALVKLLRDERESIALTTFLEGRGPRHSCALALVEVMRAVRLVSPELETVEAGRKLLLSVELLDMDKDLLRDAAEIDPPLFRSLDAIHLAAARTLRGKIRDIVTYDRRMAQAARGMGFNVYSPGIDG